MNKIQKLAVKQIGILTDESKHITLHNSDDMGEFSKRDSGFGQLNHKLYQISDWVEALLEGD